jgi:type IV fimbrial biogenesis protein FimT
MTHAVTVRARTGITLVEMLVTVVIIGIVVAAAIPSMTGLIERRRVIAAAGEVANIFAFARSETNAVTGGGVKLNLHLENVPASITDFGSCIRLSTNASSDTCTCNRSNSKACAVGNGVLLREFTLPRNQSVSFTADGSWGVAGRVVSFSHDKVATSVSNLVVKVSGARTGSKLNVEYNDAGRVRICSPDGTISGFPTCG